MILYVLPVLAYVGVSFILSAFVVRFWPNSTTATMIRRKLKLFAILPIFLMVDIAKIVGASAGMIVRVIRSSFELISGRRLYQKNPDYKGANKSRSRKTD